VGGIHSSIIQGICCNLVIHGHEEATEYQKLLDERGIYFPLSKRLQCYDTETVYGLEQVFTYYQFNIVCVREMIARL
jgi:hypothetical protein